MTRALRHLDRLAWELLVPGVCVLCGGGAQWQRCRGGLDLCEHCEAALPPAAPAPEALRQRIGASHIVAPCAFAPPADFMVRQLKFGGERSHARVLGHLLAEGRRACPAPLPQALVPVPLHASRLRERGFNQSAELARFAGRALGVPVWPRALERSRATAAQSGLAAALRSPNVAGCFAARPLPPSAAHLAVVDDVLTTGSTAAEAVRCLREAGATTVEVWVACRAGLLPASPRTSAGSSARSPAAGP